MTLRAAIYARQSVHEAEGIQQQIAHCRAVVSANNWLAIDPPYADNFVSATKPRGEGTAWAEMLADFDMGKIDVIVSVTVDRLLRRVSDVVEITKPMREVRIVTVRDGIDTSYPMGRTHLTIIAALAENEIETKNERMRPYADSRHAAGHPTPGKVPYGYEWIPKLMRDETGTRYAVVEKEAEIVKFIFHELLAGVPLGSIARGLNTRNIRTRPPKAKDGSPQASGAVWRNSTLRRMLISPFYAALLPERTNKEIHYRAQDVDMKNARPGLWEKIVTEDDVLAARHILMNPDRLTHDGDTARKWLLPGIATCGTCGMGIQSAWTKERYRGYRGKCGHFQRRAEIIDRYVENAVIGVLSTPGTLVRLPEDEVDIHALYARRTVLDGKILEAREMWRSGELTRIEHADERARAEAEIEGINSELAGVSKNDPLAEILSAADMHAVWENLDNERKRIIVKALLERVSIHPVGKGKRVMTLEQAEGTIRLKWRNSVRKYSFSLPVDAQTGTLKMSYSDAQRLAITKALN